MSGSQGLPNNIVERMHSHKCRLSRERFSRLSGSCGESGMGLLKAKREGIAPRQENHVIPRARALSSRAEGSQSLQPLGEPPPLNLTL